MTSIMLIILVGIQHIDSYTQIDRFYRKNLRFGDQLKLFEAIRDWGLRYIQEKDLKITQLGDVVEDLLKVLENSHIASVKALRYNK